METVKKKDLPIISKKTVQRNDFVELKYTGYANGEIFDSNIEEDIKKINPEAKPRKTIIIVGEGMLVPGLDNALEGKEVGKEYEVEISVKEGFGERKRELIKTIPLKIFTEKKVNPQAGMVLNMDDVLAKVISVSGGRVITDFNNPLAGKILKYKFIIVRKVSEEKEKIETVLELLLKFVPDYEIKDTVDKKSAVPKTSGNDKEVSGKVIVKGPKAFEPYINTIKDKFKDLTGKELGFEEKTEKDNEEKEINTPNYSNNSRKEAGDDSAKSDTTAQRTV